MVGTSFHYLLVNRLTRLKNISDKNYQIRKLFCWWVCCSDKFDFRIKNVHMSTSYTHLSILTVSSCCTFLQTFNIFFHRRVNGIHNSVMACTLYCNDFGTYVNSISPTTGHRPYLGELWRKSWVPKMSRLYE